MFNDTVIKNISKDNKVIKADGSVMPEIIMIIMKENTKITKELSRDIFVYMR